jgi:hypothetical protein
MQAFAAKAKYYDINHLTTTKCKDVRVCAFWTLLTRSNISCAIIKGNHQATMHTAVVKYYKPKIVTDKSDKLVHTMFLKQILKL